MPPVTVAVVSWNTRDLLERCLQSMHADHERGLLEAWVVDNASTDGSAELVAERFPWVHLIASEENLGFGRAINVIASKTSSEWVATANADIALRPGALDALLDAGARDPRAGALAPRLILPDGSTQHSAFAFPTIPYTFLLATGAFRVFRRLGDRYAVPGSWDKERWRRVPWAVAALLLVRRAAWHEVGGFDDRQWMYAEDLDLGWRLHRAGWGTLYVPGAEVEHELGAATLKAWGHEVAPIWQRSTYGFLVRRRGLAYAWAIALISAAGALPRWARAALRAARDPRFVEERDARWRWVLTHVGALRGRAALEEMR